jgi:hypothetical protein
MKFYHGPISTRKIKPGQWVAVTISTTPFSHRRIEVTETGKTEGEAIKNLKKHFDNKPKKTIV